MATSRWKAIDAKVLVNGEIGLLGTGMYFSDFPTYRARHLFPEWNIRDVYCTTSIRFWVCVVFPDVAVTVSV